MAHIEKTKGGRYRAQVEKWGVRDSKTFDTQREAKDWATLAEAEILRGERMRFPRISLADVLDLYVERVSIRKQTAGKETMRINAFKRHFPELAGKVMCETTTADWALWRDRRLKVVSGSTVAREINLFSNVYQQAMHELGPYCNHSPFTHLTKPRENPPRSQRWRWRTTRKVLRYLGYCTGRPPQDRSQEVAYVLLVGLRTAMRLQEILSLTERNVNFEARVVTVSHKMQYRTGAQREIPIQKQAARLLRTLRDHAKRSDREMLFSMNSDQADRAWRRKRDQLADLFPEAADLHIHDTRAEAITRLARKVNVMQLSRICGISDLQLLNERYYRETAEEVAARMAKTR